MCTGDKEGCPPGPPTQCPSVDCLEPLVFHRPVVRELPEQMEAVSPLGISSGSGPPALHTVSSATLFN